MISAPLKVDLMPGARQGQMVLRLQGPLTLNNIFAFQDRLRSDQSAILLVDLTEVPYIDSAGIGSLVGAHVSRERNGRQLALVGASERVTTALHVTQVGQLFRTFPTLADAEKSFS